MNRYRILHDGKVLTRMIGLVILACWSGLVALAAFVIGSVITVVLLSWHFAGIYTKTFANIIEQYATPKEKQNEESR